MARPQVVAIIQARLGSSRFPQKSLADFHGKPMIVRVVERVAMVDRIDRIVIAVPFHDNELIDTLRDHDIKNIVRGPEDDVLVRIWLAAAVHRADVVMRVTGDCPVWSPAGGAQVLRAYLRDKQRRQYWSNDTLRSGWPDGTDTEVFSFNLLKRSRYARGTIAVSDREHVTTWMRRNQGDRCGMVTREMDSLSRMKLSVDHPIDLERAKAFGERIIK